MKNGEMPPISATLRTEKRPHKTDGPADHDEEQDGEREHEHCALPSRMWTRSGGRKSEREPDRHRWQGYEVDGGGCRRGGTRALDRVLSEDRPPDGRSFTRRQRSPQ